MGGSLFKKTFGRGLQALFEDTNLKKDEDEKTSETMAKIEQGAREAFKDVPGVLVGDDARKAIVQMLEEKNREQSAKQTKREFITVKEVEPAETPDQGQGEEPTSTSMPNLHEAQIDASMAALQKLVAQVKTALPKKQMVKSFQSVIDATLIMDDLTITLIDMVESAGRIYQSKVRFGEERDGLGGKKRMVVLNPQAEK